MGFKKVFPVKGKASVTAGDNITEKKKIPPKNPTRTSPTRSAARRAEAENLACRTIRYSNRVTVYEIPSLESYPEKGDELWITCEEFNRIQQRERRLSEKKENGGCVGPDHDDWGLETEKSKHQKESLMNASLKSVLTEQFRQIHKEEYDPDRIAWVYSLISAESGSLAYERGLTSHYQLLKINRPIRRMWATTNVIKADNMANEILAQ
eukprot:scaffold5605_cov128-Cylindrotheca_fusiformis.AAC.25